MTELGVGLGSGWALFFVLAGGRLPSRLPRAPSGALTLRWLWLATRASGEELIWRGLVLAGLAVALGTAAALVLSAVGFAVWHAPLLGRRCALHAITGVGFGGAFLLAGLGGAALAHGTYNVLVDWALQARREAA